MNEILRKYAIRVLSEYLPCDNIGYPMEDVDTILSNLQKTPEEMICREDLIFDINNFNLILTKDTHHVRVNAFVLDSIKASRMAVLIRLSLLYASVSAGEDERFKFCLNDHNRFRRLFKEKWSKDECILKMFDMMTMLMKYGRIYITTGENKGVLTYFKFNEQ